jgi:hypothetical protein
MNRKSIIFALIVLALSFAVQAQSSASLTADQKAKVDSYLKEYSTLGTDPVVVKAVKEFNTAPSADYASMTQEKWAGLSVLSNEVKAMSKNALAEYLKTKRTPVMAELFVSSANGTKAAFFAKTTSWSHKGKPKHDLPMSGKTWIDVPAMDESSGKVSVQISFPVLDAGKPVGSIVIGLDVSKF